jgi:predicted HicB family RNase H-like nuclease
VTVVPRINVEVPADLHREAKSAAALTGKSLKDFVIEALRRAVEEQQRRK